MEQQWKQTSCAYLDTVLQDQRNLELTQELRLGEGMPDVGQILWAGAQCLLRGKQWQRDTVSASGGVAVRILYLPENGSGVRCAGDWIPFRMDWDLPENTPEGWLNLRCAAGAADARSVSARKVLIRTGVALQAEAYVPAQVQLREPVQIPPEVQLLKNTWPLRLRKEAGEKAFQMEESLELPPSAPVPEKLLDHRMVPSVTECRIHGNKLVFRGIAALHILYRSREGQIHGWEFSLPFSQYTQLEGEYGADARCEMALCATELEADLQEEGRLQLKSGLTAQYLVTDQKLVTTVEDAYCPGRILETEKEAVTLPVVLESRRETAHPEQTIPAEADIIADARLLPELPRLRQTDRGWALEQNGSFQVLYYGSDGALHSGSSRWQGVDEIPSGEGTVLSAAMLPAMTARANAAHGKIHTEAELPVVLTASARQTLPMITGLVLGAEIPEDPQRPSLILRRAGDRRLWDLAREAGTTVEAIRRANGLTEEADPDRMLLIPVP